MFKKNTSPHLLIFFSLLSVFLLTACTPKEESNSEESTSNTSARKDPNSITLLTSPWPPDALNYLAQEKGFFEKNGVVVELLWADGYEETFDLVDSGDLDIWNTTLLDTVSYHADTGQGETILVQDYSAGADAVVSLTGIQEIKDLAGKKVGVEKGTVGEFFLKILLERQGMILSDVNIIDTASEEVAESLKNGTIEAGVCYEPCPTEVLNLGGRIVIDSAKEPNLIADVYVAKKEDIAKRKEDYLKVLKSIIEASEFFNNNPAESAEIMQEVLDMPKEEIISVFRNLRIPSLEENFTAFDRTPGVSPLDELAKAANQYLEQEGLIEESFNALEAINPELIEILRKESN